MSDSSLALVYVHGFQSSAQSHKAQCCADYLRRHHADIFYTVPTLADHPAVAYEQLCELVHSLSAQYAGLGLLGSSLGGFYATALAQQFKLPAVLVNPAVRPYHLIKDYLGVNTNPYTGLEYCLTEQDLQALRGIEPEPLATDLRLQVLLQTGDETLDYALAAEYYQAHDVRIENGGSHAFEGFEAHLPEIIKFLQ